MLKFVARLYGRVAHRGDERGAIMIMAAAGLVGCGSPGTTTPASPDSSPAPGTGTSAPPAEDEGRLSDAQAETVIYAGDANVDPGSPYTYLYTPSFNASGLVADLDAQFRRHIQIAKAVERQAVGSCCRRFIRRFQPVKRLAIDERSVWLYLKRPHPSATRVVNGQQGFIR